MIPVKVRAVREGRFWVLYLDDGGVTQVRRLGEVDDMVADYVSLMRDVPPEKVRVEVTEIDPGEDLTQAVNAARVAQQAATRAVETAASLIRTAAFDLKQRGLTGVEVAKVLDISPQRVSQLTAGKSPAPGAVGSMRQRPPGSVTVDARKTPSLTGTKVKRRGA